MIRKIVYLFASVFLTFGFALTSCDSLGENNSTSNSESTSETNDGNSATTHEHTYSSSYEYDDTYHWHPSTCGHNVVSDKEKHTFKEEVTDPTYENGGYTTYTCSTCGYSYTDDEVDALPITITWKNYDGTVLEVDNNVPYGTMPSYDGETPTKESDSNYDYIFAGWTPSVVIATQPTTYIATFSNQEITYTVDFDLNGGTSNSYKGPIEVKTLSKDMFFFDCVKEDWSFRGWEYKGEKIFDENGNQLKNVTLVDNMVFKAIYSQTVKLSIVSNIPRAGTITGEGEYPYNTYVDVSVKPNQGYVFIGWYYQNTLLSNTEDYKYMMWDQDVTLEARFQLDSFTMHIYSNSEDHGLVLLRSNLNNNYLTEYSEKRKYTSEVTIAAYSKTDVRFLGWYDENNELVTTNAVYTFVMPNHDYTLEAKWNYFKINYNLNGGTNSENNPEYFDIDDNEIILSNPTRSDKDFIGWKYNGEFIDKIDSSIINSGKDITLEAVWSNYTYSILEDDNGDKYISITGWEEPGEELVIPETMNINGENIPAKEIGANVFKDNKTLKSVIMPDTITTIGEYAFSGCSSIDSITIPDNVTLIGNYAFNGCSNLEIVTINDNSKLTTIGSYAFSSCSSLTSIIIPDSVTEIGYSAFEGCSSLTSIVIPDSVTEIGNFAFSGCSKLIIYCEVTSKPNGWYSLWNPSNRLIVWDCLNSNTTEDGLVYYMYENEDGTKYIVIDAYIGTAPEVIIPNTINVNGEEIPVTTIGSDAFYSCSSLISITIPSSVTSIDYYAFASCSKLSTVTFSENSQLTTIGEYAFRNCSSLTSITIPNSVTTIHHAAFFDCTSLISITIPSSVTSIYGSPFSECSKLNIFCEVTSKPKGWPSNWDEGSYDVIWNALGGGVYNKFKYAIRVDEYNELYIEILDYLGTETKVVIPSAINVNGDNILVTTIGASAFGYCSSLTSITIPNSVTTIGAYAFKYCSKLSTVTFAENSQLTTIGEYAFSECSSLTSITIPNSVTTIGACAFKSCSSLTSITIPNSVTTIDYYAFNSCSKLTIYCEATSKPKGWSDNWNFYDCPVVWGYVG